MAEFKKSSGIALAFLAAALTFMGITLAATDPNPSGIAKDPLVLDGTPPHSAMILVTVSTGQSYTVSATIDVNFVTSRADAIVHFPLLFSQTSVDLRLVGDHLFTEAADVSSGKWLEFSVHPPSFFGVSLELTQPEADLHLINGFQHKSVTTSGYRTLYNFSSGDVPLSNVLGVPKKTVLGSLKVTIATGSSGEVRGATMISSTRHDMSKITLQVLSYNKRATISAPAPSDVTTLHGASIEQLLSSASITTLLLPDNFAALLQGSSQVS